MNDTELIKGRPRVTIPVDTFIGGVPVVPAAMSADAKSFSDEFDEANKNGWFKAIYEVFSKKDEADREDVRKNVIELIKAALDNGVTKEEMSAYLTELGITIFFEDRDMKKTLVTPQKNEEKATLVKTESEDKQWLDEIDNTDEYQSWVHLAHKPNAQGIFDEGLNTGGAIDSTAYRMLSKTHAQDHILNSVHDNYDIAVLVRIPKDIIDPNDKDLNGKQKEVNDILWEKGYYSRDNTYLPKEWVFGYVDVATQTIVRNPNYDFSYRK